MAFCLSLGGAAREHAGAALRSPAYSELQLDLAPGLHLTGLRRALESLQTSCTYVNERPLCFMVGGALWTAKMNCKPTRGTPGKPKIAKRQSVRSSAKAAGAPRNQLSGASFSCCKPWRSFLRRDA